MKNLKNIAEEYFREHPDVNKVYITDDGFIFLNKNAAELHARYNPAGKKLSVKTFENVMAPAEKEPENKTPDKMTVKEIKALLDEKAVEYPAKAKKDELLALLEQANESEPEDEPEKGKTEPDDRPGEDNSTDKTDE